MDRLLPFCLLISTLLLAACGGDSRLPQYELAGGALGTTFRVLLVAPGERFSRDELQTRILETMDEIDRLASTWREDSELSRFNANRSEAWIETSAEFCDAVDRALEISRLTDGAFDITVGPLVNLWGFGPDGSVTMPPADERLRAVLVDVGYEQLQTRCDIPAVRKQSGSIYIDLSGWAKGHAVDRLGELLDQSGFKDYLVEIGGELKLRGKNAQGLKWAVAVEAPSTTKRVPHSVLRLTNTGVATSGDYRNFFDHDGKQYSHTIDARTGYPVSHALAAVTVVNESTAYADAMATALLVLGPKDGPERAERLGIAAYFLIRDKTGIEEIESPSFKLLRAS